jgi:hypothetical protein
MLSLKDANFKNEVLIGLARGGVNRVNNSHDSDLCIVSQVSAHCKSKIRTPDTLI